MVDVIETHQHELGELCRRHRVRRLEIFGSAAEGRFDPAQSDLDFIVDFLPLDPVPRSRAYFGLLHDLEDLFARKIDLLEESAIANPYFLTAINRSRKVLYAA